MLIPSYVWLCMTMDDSVWLCITMYDYVWLCMIIYGYVWLCVTPYDCVWLCMPMYDYVWQCMIMYNYVWLCMRTNDYVCLCMTMYDYDYVWLSCKALYTHICVSVCPQFCKVWYLPLEDYAWERQILRDPFRGQKDHKRSQGGEWVFTKRSQRIMITNRLETPTRNKVWNYFRLPM